MGKAQRHAPRHKLFEIDEAAVVCIHYPKMVLTPVFGSWHTCNGRLVAHLLSGRLDATASLGRRSSFVSTTGGVFAHSFVHPVPVESPSPSIHVPSRQSREAPKNMATPPGKLISPSDRKSVSTSSVEMPMDCRKLLIFCCARASWKSSRGLHGGLQTYAKGHPTAPGGSPCCSWPCQSL